MAKRYSRRDFMKQTAAKAAVTSAVATTLSQNKANAANANERLRVGFIGTGGRCQAHIKQVLNLQAAGRNVEAAAVCDVYSYNREKSADKIQQATGNKPIITGDYRDLIDKNDLDVIVVATPDHWHAKMTIDALNAGKHVYCEKPMTHTIQESQDVVAAWKKSGTVMQVGVQRTSDGRWNLANQLIQDGKIGKVLQAQTEYYRNSGMGQWRYYSLRRDMTPQNIDWKMFLGTEFGLSPEVPFDRAKFAQWRCYWSYGSGMFTDLFVHRLTQMLTSTGLRYPKRVVGAGGIFMEYDGRQVPDTASIVADYNEGCQILVTASMCNDHKIEQCIRGHHGTIVFDMKSDGFEFIPERPQVTRVSDVKRERFTAERPKDETLAHWENFIDAINQNAPEKVNNSPDLGAAAVATITMGAESYRTGKVFEWDAEKHCAIDSSPSYALGWEKISENRGKPKHVPGWKEDALFQSRQLPPAYQKLEGSWVDGKDPAS